MSSWEEEAKLEEAKRKVLAEKEAEEQREFWAFANSNRNRTSGTSNKASKRGNSLLIGCLVAAVFLPLIGICAVIVLPAVFAAREAASRLPCSNHMKEIGLALHNYHATHRSLPPAYTVDAQGRPMHSWRALILPFMNQQALHARIDFSKPWDDPANQIAAETVVAAYSCPSTKIEPTQTTYVAVVDPRGIMTGSTPTKFRNVLDGLANTIMIVEADSANAVHWMSPQDIDFQTFMNKGTRRDSGGHMGGSHELMGDGAVIFITDSIDPALHEALFTRFGKENLGELILQ